MTLASATDDYARTTAHMAELGATRHVVRDHHVRGLGRFGGTQHYYALPSDAPDTPLSIPYWMAMMGLGTDQEEAPWFAPGVRDRLAVLVTWQPHGINPSITMLTRLADHIELCGYQRERTAETAYLYYLHLSARQSFPSIFNADATAADVYKCADIARMTRLTFDQRMDAASRHIDAVALQRVLDDGAPYMLAKEMFTTPYPLYEP